MFSALLELLFVSLQFTFLFDSRFFDLIFIVFFFAEIHPFLNVKKQQDKGQSRKGKNSHFFTLFPIEVVSFVDQTFLICHLHLLLQQLQWVHSILDYKFSRTNELDSFFLFLQEREEDPKERRRIRSDPKTTNRTLSSVVLPRQADTA